MHDDQRSDLATRADVEVLVRAFYSEATTDNLLGPIFDAAELDWPSHIDRIIDFWEWQLFGRNRYGRNPLRAHEPVHERTPLTDAHLDRWVDLFVATVDQHFVGPVATTAKGRATKMAKAPKRLLAPQPDGGTESALVQSGVLFRDQHAAS